MRASAPDAADVAALAHLRAHVARLQTRVHTGRILAVVGSLVRAELPAARMGELCELRNPERAEVRYGEVVGIDGVNVLLAPHGSIEGLSIRTEVRGLGRMPALVVGDHLLGAVIDAFGVDLEHGPRAVGAMPPGASLRPLNAQAPSSLARRPIERMLATGLRAIDGLLTCGEGQRIGIFGGAGVGKSSLIAQIVAHCDADVLVVGLVGERGREVGDFVARTLDPHTRARTVLVAATSDRPPLERMQAALAATAIAEHFRDQNKRVLLIIDSVTRLARALRDVALSAGEPPARRGFPPSVFSALPMLFERAGMGAVGSITAFYTVLVEGDPMSDPIAEETKSLLDGHIMLSDKLAARGHYPAIDVLESKSRLMRQVVSRRHGEAAQHVRDLLARHRDVELLLQVGEYRAGTDARIDEAVSKHGALTAFLAQGSHESVPPEAMLVALEQLAR